jgi:hypothetical protein
MEMTTPETKIAPRMSHKLYEDWYSREDVQYEIVKQLIGRETVLIGSDLEGVEKMTIRCIKAHNVDYLKSNLQAFHFFERFFNVYRSTSLLQNMPMFSYNMVLRTQQHKQFNIDFMNYTVGHDFVIDCDCDHIAPIDSKDFQGRKIKSEADRKRALYDEVALLKSTFDDFGVPYMLKNSSDKGFHFEFEDKYTKGDMMQKMLFNRSLALTLKKLYNIQSLDLNVYDFRRVFKVAYSVDMRTGLVVMPLTDEQFISLKSDNSFLRCDSSSLPVIRNRGLLYREYRKELFIRMLDSLELPQLKETLV